jgi:hypothetical protein
MRIWRKLFAAAIAPLMLSGCLWGPGKFTSNLALNKGGTFVLDYQGEIMIQIPDDKSPPAPWSDDMAVCHADGRTKVEEGSVLVALDPPEEDRPEESDEERQCTVAEIARLKAEYEKQSAEKRAEQAKDADQMAKLFGLPGSDDESNRRFAETLMKYQGWR